MAVVGTYATGAFLAGLGVVIMVVWRDYRHARRLLNPWLWGAVLILAGILAVALGWDWFYF